MVTDNYFAKFYTYQLSLHHPHLSVSDKSCFSFHLKILFSNMYDSFFSFQIAFTFIDHNWNLSDRMIKRNISHSYFGNFSSLYRESGWQIIFYTFHIKLNHCHFKDGWCEFLYTLALIWKIGYVFILKIPSTLKENYLHWKYRWQDTFFWKKFISTSYYPDFKMGDRSFFWPLLTPSSSPLFEILVKSYFKSFNQ